MENRFLFVACHYNMSKTVVQMLMSIGAQSYTNWKILITDDMSDRDHTLDAKKIVQNFNKLIEGPNHIPTRQAPQVEYFINKTKKYETLNVLTMIRENAFPDDIVCRIDCDDYLCDNDALFAINNVYVDHGVDAAWTAHRWVDEGDRVTNMNISGQLTDEDVYKSEWKSSHLKTFRASLLEGINEENFKGADGNYNRRSGDQALYLPVLHKAAKKVYIPMVTYSYRCKLAQENFQTEDAKFQKEEAEFLRSRGFVE